MKTRVKSTLLNLMLLLSGVGVLWVNGWATIRRVPTLYPTITAAVSASQSGDTIHLTPGQYFGGIAIPHDLTIASSYLFTQDSSIIESTVWQTDTSRITMSEHSLRFIGIRFHAPDTSLLGAGIFTGSAVNLQMDRCIIDGEYDNNVSFFRGLLNFVSDSPSVLVMQDCRYRGDSLGGVQLILAENCSTVLKRCTFVGRSANSLAWLTTDHGSLALSDCAIRLEGEGIFWGDDFVIDRTQFNLLGSRGLYLGTSSREATRIVRNCVIDSARISTNSNPIRVSNTAAEVVFDRCIFLHCEGNPISLIYSNGVSVFRNSVFLENQIALLTVDRFLVDSCQFIRNTNWLFARESMSLPNVFISNSDFIENNASFTAVLPGSHGYDTIIAPHCYWGDPTGPNHVLNPGGQGMMLPSFVDPFPFRTTPVFPENGIFDPGNRVTYSLPHSLQFSLYPNPTNASTTIRFAVPIASPMRGELYDRTGRLVTGFTIDQKYFSHGQYPIQLVDTPSGLYFVRLSSSQASTTQPLVIAK